MNLESGIGNCLETRQLFALTQFDGTTGIKNRNLWLLICHGNIAKEKKVDSHQVIQARVYESNKLYYQLIALISRC